MKMKYFLKVRNKDRWLGFCLAVASSLMFYLEFPNISTQWIGWLLSVIACFMWCGLGIEIKTI